MHVAQLLKVCHASDFPRPHLGRENLPLLTNETLPRCFLLQSLLELKLNLKLESFLGGLLHIK